MPIGGKLVLKGGLQVSSSGVSKKKKSKKKRESSNERGKATGDGDDQTAPTTTGISVQGNQTYEEIFNLEIKRSKGSNRPKEGHGLKTKEGTSAGQRLDSREARKADKYCK